MKIMQLKRWWIAGIGLLLGSLHLFNSMALETGVFHHASSTPATNTVQWLEFLRVQQPDTYRQIVESRKARVDEQLQRLRKEDPEEYRRVMAQVHSTVRKEMVQLRQDDPKEFRRRIWVRFQQIRTYIQKIKKDDPQVWTKLSSPHRGMLEHFIENTPNRIRRRQAMLQRFNQLRATRGKKDQNPVTTENEPDG